MNYAASVDREVPVPAPKPSVRKKYPWELMEVGDSFKIELTSLHKNIGSLHAALMSSARQWKELKSMPDRVFKGSAVEDGKAVRVWRIK